MVNFNELEENAHFILYYLVKNFPEKKSKKEIVNITGLHINTVQNKISILKSLNLLKTKKVGRNVFHFVEDDVREEFDKWEETIIGKKTINEFQTRLKKIKSDEPH
ncbi:MAG: hypothetical protein ACXADY_02990 [Candidatus Hodarchaeales archaeon]|jgi:hypothetical protein